VVLCGGVETYVGVYECGMVSSCVKVIVWYLP